ncbi:MAG: methyltransferase [Thermoguttaceae bacterium]
MVPQPPAEPFCFPDQQTCDRLREVFLAAEFTDQAIARTLGNSTIRAVSSRDVPLLLRRTERAGPLETLIRLFLIGVPLDADLVRQTIAPMSIDQWVRLGLLEVRGGSVAAAVQVIPFQGLILVHDRPERVEVGLAPDYVMGIGSSSLTLANVTIRRPCGLALDLGTGCGFQAFLAARHSRQVVAVDRNPRAVRLAALNARLNNLPNVECREGDLLEPVRGCSFDLVVSNPPFVISPESRYIYRDSGLAGDELAQRIVRQVPALLAEGGYCQILCNWVHRKGEDWRQRLAAWLEGLGCDAWVMQTDTLEADAYAARWIRHTERDDPETFRRRFERWTAYYDQERIEAISGGVITLRRRSGSANWFRADEGPPRMLGPAGQAIQLAFELHDFLETVQDDACLLDQRLRLSPDARLLQRFEPAEKAWAAVESELYLGRGLAYSGKLDPYMACLLAQCDGQRRLRELLEELAAALDQEPGSMIAASCGLIRRLIERGFLLPAEPSHG